MTTLSDEPEDREVSVVDLSIADIVLELHSGDDVAETVDRVVEHSRNALACDGAGVLLIHARGRLETIASTSEDVTQAHLLQVDLREGPCLEATEDPRIIYRVDDAVIDTQWPRWNAAVAQLGFRSILAIPLLTEKRRYGSLNFYAHRPQAFSEDDESVAMILGRHASVAMAASHEIEGLRTAIDGRKVIGIAMGMLMERYDLETHTAFDVLRRYSQANNVKLRDVAEHVVAQRELPKASQ